jgi:hypothetical protein
MKRAFLYVDILGFAKLVQTNPGKIDQIFEIVNSLNVFRHEALQTLVFSDTLLVFNKNESWPLHYYCTFLVEYAQQLFYRLNLIGVYFKGILTFGEFNYTKLSNIDAYYGNALITAYHEEELIEGFGLFLDPVLRSEIVIFDYVPYHEKYDFIILCQSLKNLYDYTNGQLPIELNILTDTDEFHRLDEDMSFLREVDYLRQHHPTARISAKYDKVYQTYKAIMPEFFAAFEAEGGIMPFRIHPEYIGSINPFQLIAESELNPNSDQRDI